MSFMSKRSSLRSFWSALTGRLAGLALGVVALALLAGLAAAPALAAPRTASHALHARYLSSTPAANAVVKAAPSEVTVHFAEPVNPATSAITIYDAKGQVVSQPAQVDPNDLTTMRTPMTGDGSEVYLVVWHTVSATDGDPDVGAFNFFVNTSGASELAPASTTVTHASQPAQSGAPIWLVIVLALAGLVVGAAGGVAWSRSRAGAQPGQN
ncbi:MAG TPA: copper resistance CopC family protein [Ktedonobacterales bacterium]